MSGATFSTRDEDFVTSPDLDFHPTDVLEDADGSLLVVDTGGWYKLCCPTSQLHKPDVLGAIYRVRRSGTDPIKDPRGHAVREQLKTLDPPAAAAELVRLLGDPRPASSASPPNHSPSPARKETALAALEHSPQSRFVDHPAAQCCLDR